MATIKYDGTFSVGTLGKASSGNQARFSCLMTRKSGGILPTNIRITNITLIIKNLEKQNGGAENDLGVWLYNNTWNESGMERIYSTNLNITDSGVFNITLSWNTWVLTTSQYYAANTFKLAFGKTDRSLYTHSNWIRLNSSSSANVELIITYASASDLNDIEVTQDSNGWSTLTSTIVPDGAISDYVHKIKYELIDSSYYDEPQVSGTTNTFEIPHNANINWYQAFESSQIERNIRVTLTTYTSDGSTQIGEAVIKTCTIPFPSSIGITISNFNYNAINTFSKDGTTYFLSNITTFQPSVQINYTEDMTYNPSFLSGINFIVNNSLQVSATLSRDLINHCWIAGADTTFILPASALSNISITITDKRGRTSTFTQSFAIQQYTLPALQWENSSAIPTINNIYRCNSEGTKTDEGTYVGVKINNFNYTHRITPTSSDDTTDDNKIELITVQYKESIDSSYSTAIITWTNITSQTSIPLIGVSSFGSLSQAKTYDIKITVTDSTNLSQTYQYILSSTSYKMCIKMDTTNSPGITPGNNAVVGVSFGMASSANLNTKKFEIPSDWNYYKGSVPLAALDAVYPIGSIYMSTLNTNPSILFGFGTWTRIQDTFLLAAGSSYAAGTTGGEANHALNYDELPTHTHNFYTRLQWYDSPSTVNTLAVNGIAVNAHNSVSGHLGADRGNVQSTYGAGNGVAHNNMPPYLAVYVWKRES